MKTNLITLLILALNINFYGFALAEGTEGPHGGDPYALEFVTLGKVISESMVAYQGTHPQSFTKWKFSQLEFKNAVESTRVVSDEGNNVILNGHEVDGINTVYPNGKKEILANRTRWREGDLTSRLKIVLHEYFGILGVEQDVYYASIDFADFILGLSREIRARAPSDAFMGNLFYGRSASFPELGSDSICVDTSKSRSVATRVSQAEASLKCKLFGKSECSLVETTYTPVISVNPIGLRYCEVLTIMK